MKLIKKVKKQSLTLQAYKMLKDGILNMEIAPGEHLVESKLAKELGTSRTVIQRALLKLFEENLIVKDETNNGMYAKVFKKKDIVDIWEVRIVLESLAAAKAAILRKPEDIKEMKSYFECFTLMKEKEWTEEEIKKYEQQDHLFHKHVTKISGNNLLFEIIDIYSVQVKSYKFGIYRYPNLTISEHLKIIEAIEAKDKKAAEALMCSHLEQSLNEIINKIPE